MSSELILKRYVKNYKKRNNGTLDVAEIARKADLPYTSAYQVLCRGRKPNADIWLKIITALGGKVEFMEKIELTA